jgi:predicted extracellular nuclease
VVDGTQSARRLMDAITLLGGPSYMFSEIAPVDGSDGGVPGGNIRVAYLYDPRRVVLGTAALARKGTAQESTAVLSSNGQTQLSVNPGAQPLALSFSVHHSSSAFGYFPSNCESSKTVGFQQHHETVDTV